MSAPTPQALPLSTNKFAAIDPTRGFDQEEIKSVTQFMAARDASTGPVTEEGKRISALNARKHGFAGAQPVIDDEDKESYSLRPALISVLSDQCQTNPRSDPARRVAPRPRLKLPRLLLRRRAPPSVRPGPRPASLTLEGGGSVLEQLLSASGRSDDHVAE